MRDRPFRPPQQKLEWPGGVVPEWAKPQAGKRRRQGKGGAGGTSGSGGAKRERLQKVMAQSGYGSRRNIEILIAQGHITVNGAVAKLGDVAGPGDKVKLDGELLRLRFGEQLPRVLLYHKPEGEIVTRDDPEGRATVFEKLPKVNGGRWVAVGRLDLNTGGLLLFTTNGELANRLMHPRFEVEREYAVRVMGEINEEHQAKLLAGIDIEGDLCKFDSIEDRGGEGSNHWYHVVLREGKNREVRKMLEALGLMVSRLMRVRYGPIALPGFLKRGMMREMNEDEVTELLAFSGANKALPSEEADDAHDAQPVMAAEVEVAEEDEVDGNRGEPEALRAPPVVDEEEDDRQPAFLALAPAGQGHASPRAHGQPRVNPNAPGGGKKSRNRHGKKSAQGVQQPGARGPGQGQGKKMRGKNRAGQQGQGMRGQGGPRAPDRRVQMGMPRHVEEREMTTGIQAYVDGKMTHMPAPARQTVDLPVTVHAPPTQPRPPQGQGKPGGRNKRNRGRNRGRGGANAGADANAGPNDNRGNVGSNGNVGPSGNRGNARSNDDAGNAGSNDNRGNVGGASSGGPKTDFDGNRES